MPTYRSTSESHTERIATAFARTLRGGEVLLLEGDLGAGKTAFVRGLAKGLGVRDRIMSPTFVLMRVHAVRIKRAGVRNQKILHSAFCILHLVHVDAYRVRDPRDLEAIGLLEHVGRPDTVVAIEWGERARSLVRRAHAIRIRFTLNAHHPERRTIAVTQSRHT